MFYLNKWDLNDRNTFPSHHLPPVLSEQVGFKRLETRTCRGSLQEVLSEQVGFKLQGLSDIRQRFQLVLSEQVGFKRTLLICSGSRKTGFYLNKWDLNLSLLQTLQNPQRDVLSEQVGFKPGREFSRLGTRPCFI